MSKIPDHIKLTEEELRKKWKPVIGYGGVDPSSVCLNTLILLEQTEMAVKEEKLKPQVINGATCRHGYTALIRSLTMFFLTTKEKS